MLPDLDLTVPAGQTLALVGTTGAGKTTLAKLATRFYDPTAGGCSSTASTSATSPTTTCAAPSSWSPRRTTCSPARSPTTSASAGPTRPSRRSRRRRAAIGAHEFIAGLPEGYDTDVANRGGRLFAGQRQLVAFARAFLADPAVLILDEATSSLDVPSERLVQQALRTVLAGPHRPDHRPPAVDRGDRRPGARHGARPARRGRRPRRPDRGRRRPVLRPAPGLARLAA